MNPHFTFLFIFLFLLGFGQKKDTIYREPDCIKFHQAEKEKFDSLKNDFQNIDFSKLDKLIIDNINYKKFKKNNIVIYVLKIRTICGNEIDFSKCRSDYNFKNNFYNENIFWDSNSVIYFRDKLKKNLIPAIFFYGFGGRSDKYFSKKIDNLFEYNLTSFKVKDLKKENLNFFKQNNKEYVFIKYRKLPFDLIKSDKIYIDFKNFLNKIVQIEIYYNEEVIPQILRFQYVNNNWEVLESKSTK